MAFESNFLWAQWGLSLIEISDEITNKTTKGKSRGWEGYQLMDQADGHLSLVFTDSSLQRQLVESMPKYCMSV